MNSDQLRGIEDTVEEIERNLITPFNLDGLSKKVGISKYHLIRLFGSISNKSLMSYVRARRLSVSLNDLINSNENILDIALKYQFQYEQSYIRAFQSYFKVTPAKYRKLNIEMPIEQKIDIRMFKNIGQGLVIQPKMVFKPTFYVQGIRKAIIHEENLKEYTTNQLAILFEEKYKPLIQNRINEHIYLALILYGENPLISNDYLPCVETKTYNSVEEPFYSFEMPLQEYAVFRYVGFHAPIDVTYKTLKELYDYIMGDWLMKTGYKQSKLCHFERMDLNVCSNDYCEMDLYFPITISQGE